MHPASTKTVFNNSVQWRSNLDECPSNEMAVNFKITFVFTACALINIEAFPMFPSNMIKEKMKKGKEIPGILFSKLLYFFNLLVVCELL